MNNARRKELEKAKDCIEEAKAKIEEAQDIIDSCKCDEDDYRDSMPENLQGSDKYYMSEEASENMDQAIDSCSTMCDEMDEIINSIDAACE